MSEIKVNKISPKQTCTQLTLGDSGDTIIVTSGANFNTDSIKNLNTSSIITQTNTTTITLGYSGSTIAIASGASQTGFGRTGTVNWDTTPKTTTVTAVSGTGYFVDTTTTTLTVNLPVGVAGAIVAVSDYANTAATNNIIIDPNSTDKIQGVNSNYEIKVNGGTVTLVYVDSTQGWRPTDAATASSITEQVLFVAATGGTILTCGDFKTHVFTGPGTFTVTNAGNPAGSNSVEYLVVAGGGGGGSDRGGAGGAGGFRQNFPSPTTAGLPVTAQGYPITVGGGGPNGVYAVSVGGSGVNSIFSTITSTGGGGGGSGGNPPVGAGNNGGSGGGGSNTSPNAGGTGNTPPVSPPQGNNGGTGAPVGNRGGGGGGAAAVGSNAGPTGGPGGAGSPIATTFFGPTSPSYGTPGPAPGRYFAGGGGGSAGSGTAGTGGAGGGGAGSVGDGGQKATAGTANTGGGGGGGTGGDCNTGNSGGSGIVVIRYKFQ